MGEKNNIRNELFEILNEMGIFCNDNSEDDIDLRDYIVDSILFVGFIVEIETKLGVELNDIFLSYDNLQSMNGFIKMLEEFVNKP